MQPSRWRVWLQKIGLRNKAASARSKQAQSCRASPFKDRHPIPSSREVRSGGPGGRSRAAGESQALRDGRPGPPSGHRAGRKREQGAGTECSMLTMGTPQAGEEKG